MSISICLIYIPRINLTFTHPISEGRLAICAQREEEVHSVSPRWCDVATIEKYEMIEL